jgi:hypothetical protein
MKPQVLKDNVIALATLAKIHKIPSVLTAGRKPGVGGVFLPELKALLPDHAYVERTKVAALEEPGVLDALKITERKTLIIAGVATDIGLLYAALGAVGSGFSVIVVLDACGTTDDKAEEIAKLRLVEAGICIAGWASLAAGLMGDFAGPTSHETMALLTQRMNAQSPFDLA